jgi:hypothetical protein
MVTYNSFANISLHINPHISPQENLNLLANCNCCETHQILKPKIFTKWIETNPNKGLNPATSNTNPATGNIYCNCECRHIARFICRTAE